jgi:DNA-directed RNA polymerase specialized sigma subunit
VKPFPRPVCKDELAEVIDQWVILSTHAERDRRILYRRFVDGVPEFELCEEFDLSRQRIQRIVDKWFDVLCEHIGD